MARPLVGGRVMNHDDSVFNRHPITARGCAETVNWNLKRAASSLYALLRWSNGETRPCKRCSNCSYMGDSLCARENCRLAGTAWFQCSDWPSEENRPNAAP